MNKQQINEAAKILASRGGKAGVGKAKARTSAQARKAAEARWAKYYDSHPAGGSQGR